MSKATNANWSKHEFGELVTRNRGTFDPCTADEERVCIELEHIESKTGRLLGSTTTKHQLSHKNIFCKGDVLFGKLRPNLRKFAHCKIDGVCSSEVWVFAPNDKIHSKYLFYVVQQEQFIQAACKVFGTKMPRADWQNVSKLIINLPPLSEQKAIASMLTKWDEAIEKTEQLIAAKQKRFEWLLRELMDKDVTKKIKLGDLVNKHISVVKGKILTEEKSGMVPVVAGGKTYPYYTNKPTHIKPTVTISSSGAFAGYVWYHNYPIWASDCIVLQAINTSTKYLYYALKHLQNKIYAIKSGSAQPHVYAKDIKNLHINFPTEKEQQCIAEVLSTTEQEIALLQQQAKNYRTQKHGLMKKMLVGKFHLNF